MVKIIPQNAMAALLNCEFDGADKFSFNNTWFSFNNTQVKYEPT